MCLCVRRGRLVLATLLLFVVVACAQREHRSDDVSVDSDEESDSVPYMVIIEHADGWRCAASLVSQRTALTTARCARPRAPARDVWAVAAAYAAGRGRADTMPAPLAAAARRVARVALAGDPRDPGDPAADLAVLELEAPFGRGVASRPIFMATDAAECRAGAVCNVARMLPSLDNGTGVRGVRLRVVDLELAADDRCAASLPHWTATRHIMFCLSGDTLCERDLGGGVVCAGMLCGVLSATGGGAGAGCGRTHAAHSVARWRRFLHCAHNLRQCGRGECASLCREQQLLGVQPEPHAPPAIIRASEPILSFTFDEQLPVVAEDIGRAGPPEPESDSEASAGAAVLETSPARLAPTRPSAPPHPPRTTRPSRTTRPTDPITPSASVDYLRQSIDFEPNRADFKSSSQSSRMRLKAGEYGDNAADYGASDDPLPTRSSALPPPLSPPPAPPAAERRERFPDWLESPEHAAGQELSEMKKKKIISSSCHSLHYKIYVILTTAVTITIYII